MSDEKASLVSVSDVFGIGRLAGSKSAERLMEAIVSGVGRMVGPWLLKREVKTHLELQKLAEDSLGDRFETEFSLDDRSRITFRTKRLVHQQNREEIAEKAIKEFSESCTSDSADSADGADSAGFEDDWISHFWRLAETVSDSDMQEIWARVLVGKASGRSYSARTLDLLRTLSKAEATIIEKLAAFKIAFGPDHPYWRHSMGVLLSPNFLSPDDKKGAPDRIVVRGGRAFDASKVVRDDEIKGLIGNTFENIFGPIGIFVEGGFSHTFAINWDASPLPLQIGSRDYFLRGLQGGSNNGFGQYVFGEGIGFSQAGWEIFSLAKVAPNWRYLEIIQNEFQKVGLELVEK